MAYSQTSRDRLAANVFIVIPVLAVLAVIRFYQRPRRQDAQPNTLTP